MGVLKTSSKYFNKKNNGNVDYCYVYWSSISTQLWNVSFKEIVKPKKNVILRKKKHNGFFNLEENFTFSILKSQPRKTLDVVV